MIEVKEIEQVFFEAMVDGWARGAKKTTISEFPGSKAIVWKKGLWRVVDCYVVGPLVEGTIAPLATPGNKSAGSTMIWHSNIPVWMMSYGGYYAEAVIALLKRVLLAAYEERKFFGCRGGPPYISGPLTYTNEFQGDFSRFSGREKISDHWSATLMGWHEYWGMVLTP